MSVNKYNPEHYHDPTPYEALTSIEREQKKEKHKFRPMVYICSPYAGDIENNIKAAQVYSRAAVDAGYIPIAPHLLFPQFLDDSVPQERELGMFFGNVLMSKCSELWVCGNTVSSGMSAEIKRAKRKGYTVRYFDENMEEKK